MNRGLQFCFQTFLLVSVVIFCTDGFSTRRNRLTQKLSNRIEKNGFDINQSLNNLNVGYKYVSSLFNNRASNDQENSRAAIFGSESLSGVEDCPDCFFGLQVSRRHATVEALFLFFEWFSWLAAESIFPDPELIEHH